MKTDQPPADQGDTSDIPAISINAKDRGELAEGGELRLSVTTIENQWNSYNVNGNTGDMSDVWDPIAPKFFVYDEAGTPVWNPDYLAEEPVVEENPTKVTMKINKSAKWGDGKAIGVKDFQNIWKACNGEDTEFECASTDGYSEVASIEQGADEQEVIVTFKDNFPDYSSILSSVPAAESTKDAKTFNTGSTGPNPAYEAGPFTVENFDKTERKITYVPNPNWWGEKPLLEKISIREMEATQTANAFTNNELDAFEVGVDPDAYTRAKGYAEGEVRQAAGPDWRHITFNSQAGELKDIKVRQAIVYGLNRTEIGASDLAGIDWPVKPLNNHFFMENMDAYKDSAAETGIDFNQEKAKSTLEEAGWMAPEGNPEGIRVKDGKELKVKFMQLSGIPVSENEALQVQNQLKAVGIGVDIVSVPSEKFSDTLTSHAFEMIAFSWLGTPYPMANINQIYGTGSDSNFAQLELPEVDTLAKEIGTEPDNQVRIDKTNQVDKILWEQVHTLPLYQRPQNTGVKKNLANFGSFGMASRDWTKVGYLK
ncbi:ABC transporter family substrate-binding protein [Propionibacteriaceae bacterium Y1700]|uniref:ABC transporter family substrate-binding protein n=1 Tax=Microlunatus sp. Y1700 TaxID=3418487 RepID=UPI003DA6D405